MEPAILFVGHGSRDPRGDGGVRPARGDVPSRRAGPDRRGRVSGVRHAGDIGRHRRVRRARRRSIAVLPGMLMAAGHAKNDIPSEIHDGDGAISGCRISATAGICTCTPRSSNCAGCGSRRPSARPRPRERARHAALVGRPRQQRSGRQRRRAEIGPHARGRDGLRLVGRLLQRRHHAAFARSAGALPAHRVCPHHRVSVLPLHRHPGKARFGKSPMEFAKDHPDVEVLCAGYLNAHPLLAGRVPRAGRGGVARQPEHELRVVQVPRATAGVRSRRRPAAGRASSSRPRHRPGGARSFARSRPRARPSASPSPLRRR